jgi:hypothetical protein
VVPNTESYVAVVTVTVQLKRFVQGDTVASYSVTRMANGSSRARGVDGSIETALAAAVAAEKSVRAGVQNAENRRLK